MNEFEAIASLVALFALRCITPLLIILTIGYVTNYLVDRWRRQDEATVICEVMPEKSMQVSENMAS